jgi:hypothetical protein
MKPLRAFLLCLTPAVCLAYSPIQVSVHGTANAAGSCLFTSGAITCDYPANVVFANISVVTIGVRVNGATGVTSITDTQGTPYTLKKISALPGTSGSFAAVYAGVIPGSAPTTGANRVTVTLNGAYFFGHVGLMEYDAAQVTTTTANDKETSTATAGINPQTCGPFTPSANDTQIVAVVYHNAQTTTSFTPVSPMVQQDRYADVTNRKFLVMDYFMSSATSISPGSTDPNAAAYSCAAVAFTTVAAGARRRQPVISGSVGLFNSNSDASPDFSFVFIADQHPDSSGAPWLNNAAYIAGKQSSWNIQGVFFSGDIQARGETLAGFYTHGWNTMLGMGVPVIASPGNHDCVPDNGCTDRVTATFDTQVGYSRISSASWGPVTAFTQSGNDIGHFTDPGPSTSNSNHAIRFTVNGHKFLVIALEVFPRVSVMTWAGNLAAFYPDHKVIYVTHALIEDRFGLPCTATTAYCAGSGGSYNSYEDSTTGQILLDTLVKPHLNSFLTLNGHFPDWPTPHYARYISTGTGGNAITSFMYDFQAETLLNDKIMRISFHELTQTFDVYIMKQSDDSVHFSWLGMPWPQ